ncbi:unnamed protein product [Ambrosiozyma monospora]|uniref:Unnamed protein product n=1 Tax=Ambrosiozyma monospora TaxID=43982 RepID=A0ACB5TAV4_AMBMO|nr:unnamed protein product [Ambrosiozyma monospora]
MLRLIRKYSTKFEPGDLVMCRPLKRTTSEKKWLSYPLKEGDALRVGTGQFKHEDIIGKHSSAQIFTTYGKRQFKYMLSKPTTEEYINLIARDAQPIYPLDAAAIVNLADLHIDYPEVDADGNLNNPPLQFFEAGTGHGSLSLQILKTIHPANCFVKQPNGEIDLSKRGAVLHTIDCRENHSARGAITINKFRRGMYSNDVEFHVSESPTKWLEEESTEYAALSKPTEDLLEFEDKEAFLSGAFLDMGGFDEHLRSVAKHLKLDAPLIIFCPSISQIMQALELLLKNPDIKLNFVRTVQLLDGAGGGLKEWDTRTAFIKATGKTGWVCRPKVGVRVCGGGFVMRRKNR